MKGKLKKQITIIVVIVILISTLPIGFFSVYNMSKIQTIFKDNTEKTINDVLSSMNKGFSGSINSWLEDITLVPARTMEERAKYALEKIDVFAQMNNKAAQQQVEQYSQELQKLVEDYRKVLEGSVSQIAIIKTVGNYVFVYPPKSEYSSDIRTQKWYEDTVNNATITFSQPFLNEDTGELEVAMGYPIMEGNNVLGVIGMYISLKKIANISKFSAVKDGNQYSSFFFLVYIPKDTTNNAPMLIAYPDERYIGLPMNLDYLKAFGAESRKMKTQYEKDLKLTEKDKKQIISAYNTIKSLKDGDITDITLFGNNLRIKINSIPGTPWKMVSAINRDIWFAPLVQLQKASKMRNVLFVILAVILLISIIIAYILLGKIFDPLAELERKILRMAQGDLREDIDYPYDNDIKLIANAVNEMKNNLKNTIEILRHQKRSE